VPEAGRARAPDLRGPGRYCHEMQADSVAPGDLTAGHVRMARSDHPGRIRRAGTNYRLSAQIWHAFDGGRHAVLNRLLSRPPSMCTSAVTCGNTRTCNSTRIVQRMPMSERLSGSRKASACVICGLPASSRLSGPDIRDPVQVTCRVVSVREVPTRFAVAFSLAGEQRQLVLPIAQEVEAVLGRSAVFYDTWYEHWIAGWDADLLLQKLYGEMAELVVMCVSGAYGAKPWTRTEHRALRSRLMQADSGTDRYRIFPVRIGDGEVEGVLFNEIVPDLRYKTPVESAELIVARLMLVRGHAGNAGPAITRWPSDSPMLQWPMADHGEARAAFARLLCEASPGRVLLVRGASETGKSHMSRQMIRNAIRLPGVVSGRFDFKGTTNMDIEVEAFSRPLGIEPPTGHILNERLAKILSDLRKRAQPTLLIFDTYEAAGEAKDWVESVLLPHLEAYAKPRPLLSIE
jgi:hypothetical protein